MDALLSKVNSVNGAIKNLIRTIVHFIQVHFDDMGSVILSADITV